MLSDGAEEAFLRPEGVKDPAWWSSTGRTPHAEGRVGTKALRWERGFGAQI